MKANCIEWGVAASALAGESQSGDQYLVRDRPDGALVAVVDGLGHGAEAARVAERSLEILSGHKMDTLLSMVRRCHEALEGTRGVVMSLARFSVLDQAIVWMGVGNVEGVLLRNGSAESHARESLLLRGGVVGGRLPPLMAHLLPVWPGDTLILATDGIRPDFEQSCRGGGGPQQIADRILANHGRGDDDALVLVARYEHPAGEAAAP
jgi:hypothetical protein